MPRKKRIKADAIREIQASGQARWKFVVCGPEDLDEIAALQREFGLTEIWLSARGHHPGGRHRSGCGWPPAPPWRTAGT